MTILTSLPSACLFNLSKRKAEISSTVPSIASPTPSKIFQTAFERTLLYRVKTSNISPHEVSSYHISPIIYLHIIISSDRSSLLHLFIFIVNVKLVWTGNLAILPLLSPTPQCHNILSESQLCMPLYQLYHYVYQLQLYHCK